MDQHVLSFSQFINESNTNEMRRGRSHGPRSYGGPRYGGSYRSRYRGSDSPYVDPKDRMRAEQLNVGVHGKVDPDTEGGKQTINKSAKMAKAITDTGKLVARMEAIAAVYPNNKAIIQPFVNRVRELLPSSKYEAAYQVGKKDGKFQASIGTDSYNSDVEDVDTLMSVFADLGLAPPSAAPTAAKGNRVEQIMYQYGFDDGEEEFENADTAEVELPSTGSAEAY